MKLGTAYILQHHEKCASIQFFVFLIIILGKQKLHSNINKHKTYL